MCLKVRQKILTKKFWELNGPLPAPVHPPAHRALLAVLPLRWRRPRTAVHHSQRSSPQPASLLLCLLDHSGLLRDTALDTPQPHDPEGLCALEPARAQANPRQPRCQRHHLAQPATRARTSPLQHSVVPRRHGLRAQAVRRNSAPGAGPIHAQHHAAQVRARRRTPRGVRGVRPHGNGGPEARRVHILQPPSRLLCRHRHAGLFQRWVAGASRRCEALAELLRAKGAMAPLAL